jgi:putative MATE family efflux protein
LHSGGSEGDLELTLAYGKDYLVIFVIGLIPYALSQAYASTLRETGETVIPMYSSVIALVCNCVLNGVFIFALSMGVRGAAIATVISRFVELIYIIAMTHIKHERFAFIEGAYRSFRLPRALMFNIAIRGMPLILNECLWSVAMTMRNQAYSIRGLDVVAAVNIASVIVNLASVVYISCGSSIAIIVGAELGAGDIEKARDSAWKLLAFSIMCAAVTSVVMAVVAPFFPLVYDTSDTVRSIATYMTLISALYLPFDAISHAAYFTVRSGGNVAVTFLMDCGFMWAVVVPVVMCIAHLTSLDIFAFYLIGQGTAILKPIAGIILLCRGKWARQLVGDKPSA